MSEKKVKQQNIFFRSQFSVALKLKADKIVQLNNNDLFLVPKQNRYDVWYKGRPFIILKSKTEKINFSKKEISEESETKKNTEKFFSYLNGSEYTIVEIKECLGRLIEKFEEDSKNFKDFERENQQIIATNNLKKSQYTICDLEACVSTRYGLIRGEKITKPEIDMIAINNQGDPTLLLIEYKCLRGSMFGSSASVGMHCEDMLNIVSDKKCINDIKEAMLNSYDNLIGIKENIGDKDFSDEIVNKMKVKILFLFTNNFKQTTPKDQIKREDYKKAMEIVRNKCNEKNCQVELLFYKFEEYENGLSITPQDVLLCDENFEAIYQ